ncbi:MAG: hypothetical protein ACRCZF_13005, partial [Gemmataceae bacterium]
MPADLLAEPVDERTRSRLKTCGEALVLLLVAFSPWPFASVEPFWVLLISVLTTLVTVLWTLDCYLTQRLHLHADRILLCLGLLLSLAVLQLVPLPQALISVLSPKASALHNELHPPLAEQLPGEAPTPRSSWLP